VKRQKTDCRACTTNSTSDRRQNPAVYSIRCNQNSASLTVSKQRTCNYIHKHTGTKQTSVTNLSFLTRKLQRNNGINAQKKPQIFKIYLQTFHIFQDFQHQFVRTISRLCTYSIRHTSRLSSTRSGDLVYVYVYIYKYFVTILRYFFEYFVT